MLNQLVTRTVAIQWEAIVVIILGIYIIGNLTWSDILFHDSYVLPIIAECYETNQSTFCQDMREKLGCGLTEQLCLGNKYWDIQKWQVFFVGSLMFAFRIGIAIVLHVRTVYKVRPFTIFMALIYGIVGANLFLFGVLDSLYFVFQEKGIPDTLPWLAGNGVFQETQKWFGDPNEVDQKDLIATNIVGFVLIIGFIFLGMFVMYISHSSRAIA